MWQSYAADVFCAANPFLLSLVAISKRSLTAHLKCINSVACLNEIDGGRIIEYLWLDCKISSV